jgi:threonine/homoserine/homoserine lactone efflux protein
MVVIEFSALLIYAWGGRGLSEWLLRRGQAQWLNRVAALLMVVVAGWLVLG